MKKLSIIVPVYNVEDYVEECIKSLIQQKYKNIEIIIVNDGSKDNSLLICEKYAKKDSRIRIYTKENGGLSDARNFGLEKASGDYITFVDSDDYVSPNIYVIMIENLEKYNAQISCCNIFMTTNESIYEKHKIEQLTVFSSQEAISDLVDGDCLIDYASWNKVYRKELFKYIRFPKGKIYEDMHIMIPLFDMCEKIILTPIPLYYYRQRELSITKMPFSIKNFDIISAYKEIIYYLDKIKSPLINAGENKLTMAKIELIWRYSRAENESLKPYIKEVKKTIRMVDLFQIKPFKNFIISAILVIFPLSFLKRIQKIKSKFRK